MISFVIIMVVIFADTNYHPSFCAHA
jgi:hypothetical protein